MKKTQTFEEEKRAEFLNVLFNGIFVCVCIVYALNFLASVAKNALTANGFSFNLLSSLLDSVALLIPFSVYFLRQEEPLSKVFHRTKPSFLWVLLGSVAACGVGVFSSCIAEVPINALENAGFVIHEKLPEAGSIQENIVSAVVCPLILAFVFEFVFRGIITKKLSHANSFAAMLVPAIVAGCLTGSLRLFPAAFFSGILLSWLYLKTSSLWLTVFSAFARTAVLYFLHFENTLQPDFAERYGSVLLVVSAVAVIGSLVILFIGFGIKTEISQPESDEEAYMKMSGKEAFVGVIRSFAFWVMVFGSIFAVYFFYLSNPNIELPDEGNIRTESAVAAEPASGISDTDQP